MSSQKPNNTLSDTTSVTDFESDPKQPQINPFSPSAIHQRKVQDLEGNYQDPNIVVIPLGDKPNNIHHPSLKPSVVAIAPPPARARYAFLDGLRVLI